MKFEIIYNQKNVCILHGHVFVMYIFQLTWAGNINLDFGYDDTNGFPTTNDNSLNNLIAVLWTHLVPGTLFYREELDPEAERVKVSSSSSSLLLLIIINSSSSSIY